MQVHGRRGCAGELGPAGEDRGESGPIGYAESSGRKAGGARGHRDEGAGRAGENGCRLSDIDDAEGIDIRPPGQRSITAESRRRVWTIRWHG